MKSLRTLIEDSCAMLVPCAAARGWVLPLPCGCGFWCRRPAETLETELSRKTARTDESKGWVKMVLAWGTTCHL